MANKEEIIRKRIERQSRGLHKKAMINPIPVSSTVVADKVQGDILKFMFSCQGKITKAAIDLGKKPKFYVNINFKIENETGGESRVVTIDKQRFMANINLDVKTFDKLTAFISYISEKPEDNLTEVSISFLWVPTVSDIEVKKFLISELEKDNAS